VSLRLAVLLLAGLLAAAGAQAAESVRRFYGYAYDLDSGRYLYTEVHAQRLDGERWLGGTIDYYAADGSRLGRKVLDFSGDAYAPQFRLEQADGSMLAIVAAGGGLELQRRSAAGASVESKHVDGKGLLCADAGLVNLVHSHLAELQSGQSLRCTILSAANLDSFRFNLRKVGDTTLDGHLGIILRLEPDSLLRLLSGPIELTYAPEDGRFLEVRGPSNIRDPHTHQTYRTRVIYPDHAPPGAPAVLPPLGS
jgi:hypothetical protein